MLENVVPELQQTIALILGMMISVWWFEHIFLFLPPQNWGNDAIPPIFFQRGGSSTTTYIYIYRYFVMYLLEILSHLALVLAEGAFLGNIPKMISGICYLNPGIPRPLN